MNNKKPILETPRISILPLEILSVIFSLLPTKDILACKLVCKLWCSVIRNPVLFSSKSIALIVHRVGDNRGNKKLHLIEPDIGSSVKKRNGDFCLVLDKNSVISFNDDGFDGFPVKTLKVVNSCKGLVCLKPCLMLSGLYDEGQWNPFFVCNPVTSDYVIVKQLQSKEYDHCLEGCVGFGCSSTSNQYKLVRFFTDTTKRIGEVRLKAEVYTIGIDENWRKIDNHPPQGYYWCGKGTFFEGSLHWIIVHEKTSQGSIVAFNCLEENFALVNLPNDLNHDCMHKYVPNMDLAVLRSRLCFCVWNIRRKDCHIWVMDEYGVKESWRKLFVISAGESPESLLPFKPLAYLNNGEILMLSVSKELVSYDVRSNSWRAVKVPGVTAKVDAMLLDISFVPTENLLKHRDQPEDNGD